MNRRERTIIVIGGGPAGMMAAIRAGQLGRRVMLLEKNSSLGRKLLLSGKGRCNLTNVCDLDSFLGRFSKNGQFLRDAFKKFFTAELMRFFTERGLSFKIERQRRVFPATDKASSILEILTDELRRLKVVIVYKAKVADIIIEEKKVVCVKCEDASIIPVSRIIVATGGVSYGFTGSTGDGLRIAERAGHRITALQPGLVPFETKQRFPKRLQGLALKNIRLTVYTGNKPRRSEIGEALFTHFGISGPLIITFSKDICEWLGEKRVVRICIDCKPALSERTLDARFLREFTDAPNKAVKKILALMMPQRMVDVFVELARVDPHKKANQIKKDERRRMVSLLKGLWLDITRPRPIKEAMVTRGGISLKDINPRTMESKRVEGLYFAGEMIDVDADTGGFNLQAAFSTGYLAGESAARFERNGS